MFPLGRSSRGTMLVATGSPTVAKTIGIVRVSRWRATVATSPPARMMSGCRPTNSRASAPIRLASSPNQRRSIRTLRPSVQPKPESACVNTERCKVPLGSFSSNPLSTPMRRTRLPCCARTASGHAAAPPRSVMNSRRFIRSPRRARRKRASHSRNSRSIFRALSKFLAEPSPIGATSLADASSAARKSAPATVAPVRLAPPKAALVGQIRIPEGCEFEIDTREIGITQDGSLQIGGFEHRTHESHGLVFHVGAKIGAHEHGPDEARSGEVGREACAGEIGPIELCALHLCCEDIRASETRSAQIGFQKPSLIEYCRSSFASVSLVLLSLAARNTAPERSSRDKSRPESFLPVKSAGCADVAAAITASISARVISAAVISGEVRSTCCIMFCAAAGATNTSPIIPNAAVQIDARLMVRICPLACSLLPARPRQSSGRGYPCLVTYSITLARPLPRLHVTEATRHISPRGVRLDHRSATHLAESECVSLNTRVEKLNLEFAVADGAALSDELVEALPRDDALSIGIGVRAVAGAWRRAVDRDAEPDRSTVRRRPEHEM